MSRVAVYPGTFDPFTNGHLDIAERAALLFDELLVAVYAKPSKNVIFSIDERLEMIRQAVKGIPNARVEPFDGLIVQYLQKVGAKIIVRGLRAVSDFEYEFQMAHMNRQLWPDAEVVCLITAKSYSFISATLIREIASLGADLDQLVPPHVAAALRKKFQA
ncbi:MAG TPA: pantetheine-phosphate adenylyltransferase [Chloroflexota bacterium]|jgi:pantetheine-phosphate adenylyltransferase|nr:pantetheine-phosphate adenylyltransferase [Chloroflexota bacterium]